MISPPTKKQANMSSNLASLISDIAAAKATIARLEAMVPAFMQKAFEEAVVEAGAAAARANELSAAMRLAQAANIQPVPASIKRALPELLDCLPLYTQVYIQSLGDRWTARFARNADGHLGFYSEQEVFYTSPIAFSKAHASRITEAHPTPTKPGNGWEHIRVGEGANEGKSIGKLLDEHRAAH